MFNIKNLLVSAFIALFFLLFSSFFVTSFAASKNLILATTTSTVDSGLLDFLIPIFEKQTGYTVKTIGVGSGMAIEMGRRGQADVLLVHSPKDEEKLVKDGFGINRQPVMHNDFVLLGSANDLAKVTSAKNVLEAFKNIASSGIPFISRGDSSGTHKKELSIWPKTNAVLSNTWYIEAGQGMGATLTIANQKNAYTISDRATYLAFKDKINLKILYEEVEAVRELPLLQNPYHVIEVNPEKFTTINYAGAKAFSDFLVSQKTQKLIENFGKDKFGGSLFFGDAKVSE
ncbi:hypothetical protein A2230_05985 [candidate division WOR-1 bacterium RIFOXYA2_FULL_36_21]|uniref:PBP domain-containing protein n=1 Tax=candidate division WOR-1 bacterium RIFOXYB2_FULL_36_35 TaxID=1802578 RepID=A0A1F4S7N1_UNCSA|nr:MAG: hypothetical protein A2230_05985 [candidate division WOR-1 bacterium RIFOXYA2_FULL_36_21]OGC16013.1 MAG: hypothetical protein A2282_05155 [candidate division WOR-1 bacterium RIFOXYA12_FULL_36_13]OGC16432.1 MAG: hypothetical protein A2290_02260 [candidate division WOR-1 bacterium RIFOXYB2_FULL_36_35]